MIGLPPFEAGAVQLTGELSPDTVATGASTAEGGVAGFVGVTGAVVAGGPEPPALAARIENVYWVPAVRPVMVQLSTPAVVQVLEPGDDVTV